MDLDQYSVAVKQWAVRFRDRIRSEVNTQTKSNPRERRDRRDRTKSISSSLTSRVREKNGNPYDVRVEWKGAVQAVFVEYGVGKGYIRVNGQVVRGSRVDKKSFKVFGGSMKRVAKPIITKPEDEMIQELADIAQEAAARRIITAMVIKF